MTTQASELVPVVYGHPLPRLLHRPRAHRPTAPAASPPRVHPIHLACTPSAYLPRPPSESWFLHARFCRRSVCRASSIRRIRRQRSQRKGPAQARWTDIRPVDVSHGLPPVGVSLTVQPRVSGTPMRISLHPPHDVVHPVPVLAHLLQLERIARGQGELSAGRGESALLDFADPSSTCICPLSCLCSPRLFSASSMTSLTCGGGTSSRFRSLRRSRRCWCTTLRADSHRSSFRERSALGCRKWV
jgi:hypothetical protein